MGETDNKKNSGFENAVVRIAAIVTGLTIILTTVAAVFKQTSADSFKFVLTVLNLIPLIAYLVFLKEVPQQEFNEASESEYCKLLRVKDSDAKGKRTRVNILVKQLHSNIRWYAIFLIIVYLLYFIDNEILFKNLPFQHLDFKRAHLYLSIPVGICNYLSAMFLFLGFKVLYDKTIKADDVTPEKYYKKEVGFSILFLSAYVIYSVSTATSPQQNTFPVKSPLASIKEVEEAISVYHKNNDSALELLKTINEMSTVRQEAPPSHPIDVVSKIKDSITSDKAIIYEPTSATVDKIKNITTPPEDTTHQKWLNRFQLIIGICNGLAMALLFGRYISMEHSAYNMEFGIHNKERYRNIIHQLTIYLLPIYALAQPLFGSFEIEAFGKSNAFANWVFLVCWIGKVFFLWLTYRLIKGRFMHLYLHSVINSHGIPKELVNCFKPTPNR